MSNFRMRTYNASLTFRSNGQTNTARVRISRTSYVYGVNSTESHARLDRAFYPHRRALGQFAVTVDCIGYAEFRKFMNWLREYAHEMFRGQVGNKKGAATMEVFVPSRNFHMIGVLTTGIDDHDHVGSMLFQPVLTFMLLKDFNDSSTAIVSTDSISKFRLPAKDREDMLAFFPGSTSRYHDTDSSIYDDPGTSTNQDPTPDPVIPAPGTVPGGPVRFQ